MGHIHVPGYPRAYAQVQDLSDFEADAKVDKQQSVSSLLDVSGRCRPGSFSGQPTRLDRDLREAGTIGTLL